MTTEWKPCPVCGESDMRHEPEDNLDGGVSYIVTCTNLACASNGGANASALLKRIMRPKTKHEPLFDLAVEVHDDAEALHKRYVKELDTMESMTDDHEQGALYVESALRNVVKETLNLMNLTRSGA